MEFIGNEANMATYSSQLPFILQVNKPLFSFEEVTSLSNDMWFPIPREVLPSGEVKVHSN